MSVLQEILSWSQSLPAWQSDAIARLFMNEVLSSNDLDDLFALLKAEHGIPDPKGRVVNKLSPSQIPVPALPNNHIKLVALKNLRYVNKIANNQRLPFIINGMTIIYGDNGSGKSGYSRVIKRACRARDQIEPILPDAGLPSSQNSNAEAIFEYEVDGILDEVSWVDGQSSPSILSSLAVFDSRCARSYLDDEGDFSYIPYGLDILQGLAGACNKLKEMTDAEYAQSATDKTCFADLIGNTSVGKLLSTLSYRTKPELVEALATFTPEEKANHAEIQKNLNEDNPQEKAVRLRLNASRIVKLSENVTQKIAIADDTAFAKLRGAASAYDTALAAATLVTQGFVDNTNLLPGTGGNAWKELFEAARKFSLEAYPGIIFPEFDPNMRCLLCQQPLAAGETLLKRFEEFIQREAEKNEKLQKIAFDEGCVPFADKNLSLGIEDELYAEVNALDMALASDIRIFADTLSRRYEIIKAGITSRKWDSVDILPPNPAAQLQALANRLYQEAEVLEKLTDENTRIVLQTQLEEYNARARLAIIKQAVLTAIQRLDHQAKLSKCLSALKTNAISNKASELTERVVSSDLETALNREFKNLGVGNLKVCLKSRSEKGKAFHKLRLDLPQAKKPGDILSEGEQRAIAISSFLAEINISGNLGGIVFDDPVSSLDHVHRELVAKRLAIEATKRQVIIFTHDIYFLCVLGEEARNAGVDILTQSLTHRPTGYGVVDSNLPFECMNTKSRVGELRYLQQQAAKIWKSGDESEYRRLTADAYRILRITWERAVEEVLFRNVVLRFRKGISTKLLAGVEVQDADYSTIDMAMTKCSNYAHDQALLGGRALPEPDGLLDDINTLETWRLKIENRSAGIQKRRK